MARIRYILSGFFNLLFRRNRKEKLWRMNVCYGCPDRKGMFCGICHCFLPSKCSATYLKDQSGKSIGGCPRGRW